MSKEEYTPRFELTKQLLSLLENETRYRAVVKECSTELDPIPFDSVILDFEIVGLCQHPEFCIKPVEPIRIIVGDDFLPIVFFEREDFPSVPHSNIYEDKTSVSMCYSDQTYDEIKERLNGGFLLECINNWFVKTARNELHRADQPLDPFFIGTRGTLILSSRLPEYGFSFFEEKIIEGERFLFQCDDSPDKGDCFAVCHIPVDSEMGNILHRVPKTLFELQEVFPRHNIYDKVKAFIECIYAIRHDPRKYQELFECSSTLLLKCKTLIVMDIPLIRSSPSDSGGIDFRAFIINDSLDKLFADFGYVKNAISKKRKAKGKKQVRNSNKSRYTYTESRDSKGANTRLDTLSIHPAMTSTYARKTNNSSDEEYNNMRIVQIGAGALGSRLFEDGIRSGITKWKLIDDDKMLPHNLARHTLAKEDIGEYKASALVKRAKSILVDSECEAITQNFFSNDDKLLTALKEADLIIDASASIPVERQLALDSKTNARKMSLFLNPVGSSTILLLEDAAGTIRLDLLEMQYYKELLRFPTFENHLKQPDAIVYSTSCRSISKKVSTESFSLGAALGISGLKKYIHEPEARIVIWTLDDLEVRAQVVSAVEWVSFQFAEWTIYVEQDLLGLLYQQRSAKLPNETGGVLVGRFDCYRKILYIADQIESPTDSIASPTSYIRGCVDLEANIERVSSITSDNLHYIGEWHSHPTGDTTQSVDDIKLMSAISSYNHEFFRPSCMVIIGEKETIDLYINE